MDDSDKALINKLNRRLDIYREVVERYADPLVPYDNGEFARTAIANLNNPNYRYNRLKDFVFKPIWSEYDSGNKEDYE